MYYLLGCQQLTEQLMSLYMLVPNKNNFHINRLLLG